MPAASSLQAAIDQALVAFREYREAREARERAARRRQTHTDSHDDAE